MRATLAAALLVGFSVGLGSAWMVGASRRPQPAGDALETRAAVDAARVALDAEDVLERLNRATRNIAAAVEPSVVHISVQIPFGTGRRRVSLGQGSGWVWDNQGHIITNAHVIDDAQGVLVQLHDGRLLTGKRLGADPSTDIAVLKLDDAAGLVPARRASGEPPRQGDRVYAFGSPFGFKFSMNEGIISGLSRDPGSRSTPDQYTNFIQSDAAVNPGHSGGPLVDIRGRVVGMNVAIATGRSPQGGDDGDALGQSAGISFAIPLDTIEPVVDQLIQTGTVVRGFLGINMPTGDEQNLAELADRGFEGQGVVVTNVVDGAPAERAGLRSGDVITGVNGFPVATVSELRSRIATTRPGQTVRLRVRRATESLDLTAVLADLQLERTRMVADALTRAGVLKYETAPDGVRIVGVRRGSPAERAGLERGQVIIKVMEVPVASSDALENAVASTPLINGGPVVFTVRPETGDERTIILRP